MKAILLLLYSEFRSRPGWSLFFILNLSLGLSGIGILEILRGSIRDELQLNARKMFAGDLRISATEPLPQELDRIIKKNLPPGYESALRTSLYTMLGTGDAMRLVRVRAISQNWPLYGSLSATTQAQKVLNSDGLHKSPRLWMEPMLATLLNTSKGQKFQIGDLEFEVAGKITENSARNLLGLSFSPEVFISQNFLQATQLIGFGSRVRYEILLKLPSSADLNQVQEKLEKAIQNEIPRGRFFRVQTYEDAGERVRRGFENFERYLALAGMIALLLSVCGISVFHASYLEERIPELAILRILGLGKNQSYLLILTRLIILGILASLVAVLLASGLVFFLDKLLPNLFPGGLRPGLSPYVFGAVFLPGISGAVIPCLPALRSLSSIELTELLKSAPQSTRPSSWKDPIWLGSLGLFIGWVFLLSSFQARSLELGSLFTLCIVVASLVLLLVGKLLIGPLKSKVSGLGWTLSYTLRDLSRTPGTTLLCIVFMGLGALLISVLPQIEKNLAKHLSSPKKGPPDFFLFDIQPQQVEDLLQWARSQKIQLSDPVPMIRSRLVRVNQLELRDYLSQREKDADSRGYGDMLLRRGANLSYPKNSKQASASEQAEISLENGFARKLGLKLGDRLQFDIQGLEFSAKIVDFRKVTWNSYQPNFFILGSEKALAKYPATFLATIKVEGQQRSKTLSSLVREFQNISAVDIHTTLELVAALLSKMSYGIYFLAVLAILSGLAVLFSISHFEIYREAWKWNLLRILGADRRSLQSLVALRCLILSVLASSTAFLLSYPIARVLWMSFFQEGSFTLELSTSFGLTCLIPLLSVLIGVTVSREILRQKPASLFQSV
jgi:putative ABC transport system permease protein